MTEEQKRLHEIINELLTQAQTIRINQVQMAAEMKGKKAWPDYCLANCDKAWRSLNNLWLESEKMRTAVTP